MPGRVNGFSLAYTGAGAVVLWSGIKGTSLSTTFKGLLQGKAPTADEQAIGTPVLSESSPAAAAGSGAAAAAGNTGAATATAAANQAVAKLLAAPYGWSTGTQWNDLVSLWNQESGWNSTAQNPGSTAYGIAQFLDSTWAPYGAKTSSASLQIQYGLEYIKATYGSPSAAWAHEKSAGWY